MMAVDASAVLAILFEEPEGPNFEAILLAAGSSLISPVNHWEVLARAHAARGKAGAQIAEDLMRVLGIEVASCGAAESRVAASAFVRFGKGTPARLNLGDCFAYALAQAEGDGLLFKGDDFPRTDVRAVI